MYNKQLVISCLLCIFLFSKRGGDLKLVCILEVTKYKNVTNKQIMYWLYETMFGLIILDL